MTFTIVSEHRLYPSSYKQNTTTTPIIVPLSLIDNTVLTFSNTSGAWIYKYNQHDQYNIATLTDSLIVTLQYYSQWCGHLTFINNNTSRLQLMYNTQNDPGLHLQVVESDIIVSDTFPSYEQRCTHNGIYQVDSALTEILSQLVSTQLLALNINECHKYTHSEHNIVNNSLPCISIQVTRFQCHSIGIGIKICHPLADAATLLQFMEIWSYIHRCGNKSIHELPCRLPLFDPTQLDAYTAGIQHHNDNTQPNTDLIKQAHSLPRHRYDWFNSTHNCPPPMLPQTQPFNTNDDITPCGDPMPWHEWNIYQSVQHTIVHFTMDQINNIYTTINSMNVESEPSYKISHLDALLAHVWICIVCARYSAGKLSHNDVSHLNLTLGLRQRLPLSMEYVGSPLLLCRVSMYTDQLIGLTDNQRPLSPPHAPYRATAQGIRHTIQQFNPSSIGAILHELSYDTHPHRIWSAFLGNNNCIFTSWLKLNVYGIQFIERQTPYFAIANLPPCDGLIQVMESTCNDTAQHSGWTVSLHLQDDVMHELITNPYFKFKSQQSN